MGSKDYYGTRSMRLYQWSLRQERKLQDFYEERIEPATDSVESTLDYLNEKLEDRDSFLTAENVIQHLERDDSNDR